MTNSFSYNQGIPAAGNAPKNDQPLMQTNFTSISGLISVDHLGFRTADTPATNGGFHKVVHQTQFSKASPGPSGSNNPPTLPALISNIGQLITVQMNSNISNSGTLTDEVLWFESGGGRFVQITGNITAGSGNQSNQTKTRISGTDFYTGYSPLLGGFFMQCGYIFLTAAFQAVVFPLAFPNACMNVQVTLNAGTVLNVTPHFFKARDLTTTGFNLDTNGYTTSGSATCSFFWVAIGF